MRRTGRARRAIAIHRASRRLRIIRQKTSPRGLRNSTQFGAPFYGGEDAGPFAPSTSDDAVRLAIKLAVDSCEYERAAALLVPLRFR
jgi:hypothetical protein